MRLDREAVLSTYTDDGGEDLEYLLVAEANALREQALKIRAQYLEAAEQLLRDEEAKLNGGRSDGNR